MIRRWLRTALLRAITALRWPEDPFSVDVPTLMESGDDS